MAHTIAMGKLTKKLVVYLDQNFISDMAKADVNERVKPEFSRLFELLHRGFIEEKLVVPRSYAHEDETSLAPHLAKSIRSYLGYLGQIALRDHAYIQQCQLKQAIERFKGESPVGIEFRDVFWGNPDNRTEKLDFRGCRLNDASSMRQSREYSAKVLNVLRMQLHNEGTSYADQRNRVLAVQVQDMFREHKCLFPEWLGEDVDEILSRVVDDCFDSILKFSSYAASFI
ncbi:MAG: hypothetical protein KKH67_14175, partial [candidate division Zixibacteria bacterium]|nr:hypothetical protein [candidate division Zixibacteria bacterium]